MNEWTKTLNWLHYLGIYPLAIFGALVILAYLRESLKQRRTRRQQELFQRTRMEYLRRQRDR